MSNIVDIFCENEVKIIKDKKSEFEKRIEKLFYYGGMLKGNKQSLLGMTFYTLSRLEYNEEERMFANYNVYDESFIPKVGYDKKDGKLWNNWNCMLYYLDTVVAAYVLYQWYVEDVSLVYVGNVFINGRGCNGWLNYLFDESYYVKNFDPWKLYENLHYRKLNKEEFDYYPEINKDTLEKDFMACDFGYSYIGICEIYAVEFSVKEALEKFGEGSVYFKENNVDKLRNEIRYNDLKCVPKKINTYRDKCIELGIDEEKQFSSLMDEFFLYYNGDKDKYLKECDDLYKEIFNVSIVKVSDAPAFFVKSVCELYHKEFWSVWDNVKDIVYQRNNFLHSAKWVYMLPVTTWEYFNIDKDDVILHLNEDCGEDLSEEVYTWFEELKKEYDSILNSNKKELSIKDIINLLILSDKCYGNIYVREEFFDETLEHISDERYQALWLLFEKLITNQELFDIGRVVFVGTNSKKEKYEIKSVDDLKKVPYKELVPYHWSKELYRNEKNNKARVILRRYLALLANERFRKEVFGF